MNTSHPAAARDDQAPSPCCAGVDRRVPRPIDNPPGLPELSYRVGEHADFLATMLAALGTRAIHPEGASQPVTPLRALSTRSLSDPAVALLDAAAGVADVLTFYQERIANENYLRTATEDRSVAELGRLVGYAPRPGVSAAVPLAFELEATSAPLVLPAGTRAQSVPEMGQFPQTFETIGPIEARVEWNRLPPLAALPPRIEPRRIGTRTIYLEGTATGLNPGDPLLLVFDPAAAEPKPADRPTGLDERCELWRVVKVDLDARENRTAAHIQTWAGDDPVELEALRNGIVRAIDGFLDPATVPYGFVRIDGDQAGPGRLASEDTLAALRDAVRPSAPPSDPDRAAAIAGLVKLVSQALEAHRLAAALRPAGLVTPAATILAPELDAFIRALETAMKDEPPPLPEAGVRTWYRALRSAVNDYDRLQFAVAPTGGDPPPINSREHAASIILRYLNAIDATVATVMDSLDGDPVPALRAALARLRDLRRDLAAEPSLEPLATRVQDSLIVKFEAALADPAGAKGLIPPAVRDYYLKLGQGDPVAERVRKIAESNRPRFQTAATPSKLELQTALTEFHKELGLEGYLAPQAMPAGVRRKPPLQALDEAITSQTVTLITSTFFELIENTFQQAEGRETGVLDRLAAVLGEMRDAMNVLLGDAGTHPGFHFDENQFKTFHADLLRRLDPNDHDARADELDEAARTALAARIQAANDPAKMDAMLAGALLVAAFERLATFLGRESRLFDGGSFPRLRPFFDSFAAQVDALRRSTLRQSDLTEPMAGLVVASFRDLFGKDSAPGRAGESLGPVVNRLIEDDPFGSFLRQLIATTPGSPTKSSVARDLATAFGPNSDLAARLLLDLAPELRDRFYPALARADVLSLPALRRVEALRIVAAPFGSYAPPDTSSATEAGTGRTAVSRRDWDMVRDVRIDIDRFNEAITSRVIKLTITSRGIGRTIPIRPDDPAPKSLEGFGTVTHTMLQGERKTQRFEFNLGKTNFALDVTDLGLTAPGGTGAPVELRITPAGGEPLSPVRFIAGSPLSEQIFPVGEGRVVVKTATRGDNTAAIHLVVDDQASTVLALDAVHDKILPGSHIVLARAGSSSTIPLDFFRVVQVAAVSRADFGITAKVSELTLDRPWLQGSETSLADLRRIAVLAQGEVLALVDEPYDADIRRDVIVLDDVLPGLSPGRSLLIEGERTDLPGTRGVRAAELATIVQVEQVTVLPAAPRTDPAVPVPPRRPLGRPRTQLTLAAPLRFSYVRDQATIYGNVAPANHGETVAAEILGGGDPGRAPQRFALRQKPLTHVAAVNEAGALPALEVRVDGVRWRRVDRFDGLSSSDRVYMVQLDDTGAATVLFGDGREGAQPPTGYDNIIATYRYGIGPGGNVAAGQISQLASRPLGLKGVINPLPATGGAGPDPLEAARSRVSVGLRSLGRLVSIRDYEDYALRFAGIAKARAAALPGGRRGGVHVTVAAVDDAPLTETSDLIASLTRSMRENGQRAVRVVVQPRWLRLILMSVAIEADPDLVFDDVARGVRRALERRLAFPARSLAEDLVVSDLTALIQAVPGVVRSHITAIGLLDERNEIAGRPWTPDEITAQVLNRIGREVPDRLCVKPAEIDATTGRPRPAELAYLSTTTPATLQILPSTP